LATVIRRPVTSVSLSTFLDSTGRTVLRFSINVELMNGTTSETAAAALRTAVRTAVQDENSVLYVASQPVANSFQSVIDCATWCAYPGTLSSVRDQDNTRCICACDNSWMGNTCATCPTRYGGAFCSQCAEGLIGYPTCEIQATSCDLPNSSRVVRDNTSVPCASAIRSPLSNAYMRCLEQQCACLSGSFNGATAQCSHAAATSCREHVCSGGLRECLHTHKVRAMNANILYCANDTEPAEEQAQRLRAWCTFDACRAPALANCSNADRTIGCSSTASLSSANRPPPSLLFCLFLCVLLLATRQ